MFRTDKLSEVSLKASPSLSYNNLASNGTSLAYVHLQEVHLINESVTSSQVAQHSKVAYKDTAQVIQAKFVKLHGIDFLVIGTENGCQVFDSSGNRLFFNHALIAPPSTESEETPRFCRGITSASVAEREYLIVGSSYGDFFAFSLDKEQLSLAHTIKAHKLPICDAASEKAGSSLFATADDEGTVHVWDASSFNKDATFLGDKYACTSLCFAASNLLVCAYLTGRISIYDWQNKYKLADIAAHSRAINALDVHPSRALIASASEDQYVHVWNVPITPDEKIKCVFSGRIANALICGVRFVAEGNGLASSTYDGDVLRVWHS